MMMFLENKDSQVAHSHPFQHKAPRRFPSTLFSA